MDTTTTATSGKLTLAFASESSTMVPFLLAGYCEWMVGNYGGIPDRYTRHVEAWDSSHGQTVREFTLDIDLASPGTYDDVCGEGGRYIVMTFIHHPESLPLFASILAALGAVQVPTVRGHRLHERHYLTLALIVSLAEFGALSTLAGWRPWSLIVGPVAAIWWAFFSPTDDTSKLRARLHKRHRVRWWGRRVWRASEGHLSVVDVRLVGVFAHCGVVDVGGELVEQVGRGGWQGVDGGAHAVTSVSGASSGWTVIPIDVSGAVSVS